MFYCIVALLVVLDSMLLSSPNLLGKFGMFIYKAHYLRTFPRTLLTVSVVVMASLVISWVVSKWLKKWMSVVILLVLIGLTIWLFYQTVMEFSHGTLSHIGRKFRYGTYLLPAILLLIFSNAMVSLPKNKR